MEDSVSVLKFAECRAKEIITLMNEVTQKEPKSVLQRLPFHMRRRAASHNPRRLPRNLRLKTPEEPISKHKKKKKPPKNRLEEYNSRQKTDLWLPTHIWFAKRFHMKRMWNYQLPFQATGKRFRSSHRAIAKNALIQDLSYYCCIELHGEEEKILSKLACLTDESLGMNFASESYIDGSKEGHSFLYHPNTFPLEAIGPISFLWRPRSVLPPDENSGLSDSCVRQLWIWCHPSITQELVKVFTEIFQMKEMSEKSPKEYTFASHVNYMKCKLNFQNEPMYASDDDIKMCVLKDTLVRHRIVGPKALSIITSILKPIKPNDSTGSCVWEYLSNPQSAYFIPLKTVIGLTVEDPRLYITSKDMNIEEVNLSSEKILNEFSKSRIASSELWEYDKRNEVTAAQVSEAVLNSERSKYVVPKASDLSKCTTSIPVIVIHQPSVNGYAPGWDIIAPQGWGMAFWIPFIYHGAQPAGFDDLCCTNFESSRPTFPLSFPDTEAGSLYEEAVRVEKLKKFNRYSRAKRPNFKILGVPTPFFMDWKLLVCEWEREFMDKHNAAPETEILLNDNNFFTLRNRNEIIQLQNLHRLSQRHESKEFEEMSGEMITPMLTCQNMLLKALVLVKVKCLTRGVPTYCSGIYLPNEFDLQTLKLNHKDFGPNEPNHKIDDFSNVPAKKRRKLLKDEAKIESKKLDRPSLESLLSFSERKIFGYVSEGGYSRLCSKGYGIGHCVVSGFLFLLRLCSKNQSGVIVLIREQSSSQYRPANIELLS